MKDEKERMQEFLKDYTNAHGDLPKTTGIDKTIHKINVSLKTLGVIATIIAILMLIVIGLFVYSKTYLVFSMNKKDFIKEIEKKYGQKIEIVEDNSTVKGNGFITFKTKKEPYITFNASKNIHNSYHLDLEENAFMYYLENSKDKIFEDVKVDKEYRVYDTERPEFKFLHCTIFINVDSYNDIEQACRKRKELQEWMKDRIKTFSVSINLNVKGYTSYLWSYEELETLIYKEKYQYYWYLKNNGKDMNEIPQQDRNELNRPERIEVLINGKRVIDKEEKRINEMKSSLNIKELEPEYLKADYKIEDQKYQIYTKRLLESCDKFEILSQNTNEEFSFKYKEEIYGVHYIDDKTHGNKLPYMLDLSDLEKVFGAKLEYDYDNKKVNVILE